MLVSSRTVGKRLSGNTSGGRQSAAKSTALAGGGARSSSACASRVITVYLRRFIGVTVIVLSL